MINYQKAKRHGDRMVGADCIVVSGDRILVTTRGLHSMYLWRKKETSTDNTKASTATVSVSPTFA